MKPMRVWAVARKELTHVARDWRSLGMAIAIPMLLMVLYGYALTLDVDNVPLMVWDQSDTRVSRDFVARFAGSRYFSIVGSHRSPTGVNGGAPDSGAELRSPETVRGHVRNYPDLERAIDDREALAALVIPVDFARRIDAGRPAEAQFIVDGSDSNTATIALGYAEAVAAGFSQDVILRDMRRKGGQTPRTPLDLRPRVWFNADLESRNYIIPGLIAIIMMVISALLTSLTVAGEWERGTMEQLISTPIKPSELILGKLLPYFAIGMFDVLVAVLMGQILFQVPLRGSAALLFLMAAVFLAGALAMGMLISIVAKNQLVASQLAMITTFVPAFLLSGFVFAIANMPHPIRVITYLVPARYFVALLKGIYLKGVGLHVLAADAVLMTVFGLAMVALANRKLKKRLT